MLCVHARACVLSHRDELDRIGTGRNRGEMKSGVCGPWAEKAIKYPRFQFGGFSAPPQSKIPLPVVLVRTGHIHFFFFPVLLIPVEGRKSRDPVLLSVFAKVTQVRAGGSPRWAGFRRKGALGASGQLVGHLSNRISRVAHKVSRGIRQATQECRTEASWG